MSKATCINCSKGFVSPSLLSDGELECMITGEFVEPEHTCPRFYDILTVEDINDED